MCRESHGHGVHDNTCVALQVSISLSLSHTSLSPTRTPSRPNLQRCDQPRDVLAHPRRAGPRRSRVLEKQRQVSDENFETNAGTGISACSTPVYVYRGALVSFAD